MFAHAVMKTWHPMIGIDLHIPWPPGSPSPAPSPVPYQTRMVLFGTGVKATLCPSHLNSGFGTTIAKGSDIGPLIPHMGPPSVTLAVEMLFSSSKCHFGPANVKADGNVIACALGGMVNPNLNCGTPCPTPTGMVLALNTYGVSMSPADVAAGLAGMAVDMVVQTALNALGNVVAGYLQSQLQMIAPYIAMRLIPQIASKQVAKAILRAAGRSGSGINDAARALMRQRASQATALAVGLERTGGTAASVLTNAFVGGPMGADANDLGLPTAYSATKAQSAAEAATNYLGSASVEDHSGAGSAPSPTDTAASPSATPDGGSPHTSGSNGGAPETGGSDGGVCSADGSDSGGTSGGTDSPDAGVSSGPAPP